MRGLDIKFYTDHAAVIPSVLLASKPRFDVGIAQCTRTTEVPRPQPGSVFSTCTFI